MASVTTARRKDIMLIFAQSLKKLNHFLMFLSMFLTA